MIFRQITHDDLGCASYLIGDEQAGVAAVVDPRFEIDEYLELAQYIGSLYGGPAIPNLNLSKADVAEGFAGDGVRGQ